MYINAPNPIAGAFLFSIGLLTILLYQFELYTGKIGYFRNFSEFHRLLIILLFNLIGCCILFMFPVAAAPVLSAKLQFPWYTVLGKSILCGILVYISVDQFKKGQSWVTLIGVPAFILLGGEHCIADFCYMILTRSFSLEAFGFLALVILGNSIGSLLFSILINLRNKKNEICTDK